MVVEERKFRPKIDVSRSVNAMEHLLRLDECPLRRQEVIALLRCWQTDDMLDDASRERARRLVHTFGSRRAPDDSGAATANRF